MSRKIVALAGGVGGAKLAYGLYHTVPAEDLTIIVNTGDDFEHLGLYIAPDLDTVMYTLADLANPETGWGVVNESWNGMTAPTWFRLGDQDLATHLLRTQWWREGRSYAWITSQFCARLGITCTLLPMCETPVRTMVQTATGELPFQEYFVHQRTEPMVTGVRFNMDRTAAVSPQVREAIQTADAMIFCPSNPFLSIDPILAVPGLRDLLVSCEVPRLAVSPIVGGRAIKGPAAKMMAELGLEVSSVGVAGHLGAVITHIVIDEADRTQADALADLGLSVWVTDTVMKTTEDKTRLARVILDSLP